MTTGLSVASQQERRFFGKAASPGPPAGEPGFAKQTSSCESPLSANDHYSRLDAVRAFAVVIGPSLAFDFFAGGSIVAACRGALTQPGHGVIRVIRPMIAAGVAAPVIDVLALRPWLRRWGATREEVDGTLAGDELQPAPGIEATRAITIDAPIAAVWPWLAQIGQDRGGFYSYEWLENLAGCRMRNADRIHPEWQQRVVGETVLLHPATGLKVAMFEPNRIIALENWGTFVLEPMDEERTRLIARSRTGRGLSALFYACCLEIPHFIMERRMLLGIKARAEHSWSHGAVDRSCTSTAI